MVDPYLSQTKSVFRLVDYWEKHKNLIIAFDFDDTIYDFHKKGYTYDVIINLLKECQDLGFTLVLFTSNEGERLKFCEEYCKEIGLKDFYVNDSPVNKGFRKPYYNILLDDKAGLGEAYYILTNAIKQIKRKVKSEVC